MICEAMLDYGRDLLGDWDKGSSDVIWTIEPGYAIVTSDETNVSRNRLWYTTAEAVKAAGFRRWTSTSSVMETSVRGTKSWMAYVRPRSWNSSTPRQYTWTFSILNSGTNLGRQVWDRAHPTRSRWWDSVVNSPLNKKKKPIDSVHEHTVAGCVNFASLLRPRNRWFLKRSIARTNDTRKLTLRMQNLTAHCASTVLAKAQVTGKDLDIWIQSGWAVLAILPLCKDLSSQDYWSHS